MANYTKTTDFAAKDTLPGGDTNKVVRGSEFETEFDAISTAIATKSDTAGPTFTGTVTIPTADINGGNIDGTVIGASSAAAGTFTNLVATSADINGGTVDGATIGGSSAGAGTFTNLTASGTVNFNGATISNLGTITTANLDGGTADNVVIGGSTPAAGTFTSVVATTADINGGTADNVVIGGSTAAAGTFTTLAASSLSVGGSSVLTSVAFSDLQAGAVTTSSETFADSDTQIPTNAAVKDHVEAVIPTLSVTEASVTAHQAALAIAATQITSLTSTVSELNILDGVTATTAELNILDGVTSTATELNILDGVTASTAELNLLDGVTATTAELNYVDGVTSNIQTQLDNISPSPTFTATADGAIANGDTLIVTSAGKLKAAGIDIANVNPPVRNATVFNVDTGYAYPGGNASYAFDTTTNQTAMFYSEFQSGSRKSGVYMVAMDDGVGAAATLSKGSFNELVGSNTYIEQYEMLYDPDISKLVIFYRHPSSTRLYAVVGTVSGTSVSFATAVEASTDAITYCRAAYDTTNNKYIVVYKRGSNLYGRVVSISGTTPSFESEVTIYDLEQGVDSQNITIAFSPDDDKFIVAFQNDAVSTITVRCRSLAISGSSITVGTDTQILAGNVGIALANNLKMVYDTEHNVFAMSYTRSTNSYYVDFRTLSISGSGVTVGTEYTLVSVGQISAPVNLTFNPTDGKCYIAYRNSSSANYIISADAGNAAAGSGTVPGTALKVSADSQAFQSYVEIVYDSHRQKMTMTGDNGSDNDLESYVVSGTDGSTNLTAENYVGIADAAYSDGNTATCQTVGAVDDAQSSLTPGQLYYVQNNGSLSTSAGSPSVVGGVAIASTKLLITRS